MDTLKAAKKVMKAIKKETQEEHEEEHKQVKILCVVAKLINPALNVVYDKEIDKAYALIP